MARKKKDEEILSELTGVSQEDAIESIKAANQAFSKEKVDSDHQEQEINDLKKIAENNEKVSGPELVNKIANSNIAFEQSNKRLAKLIKGISETDSLIKNPDGSVNWRKMIKPEFMVFNLQFKDKIEKEYGKPIGELTVDEVDDKYLLLLLAGIKEVAKLRGFKSVKYPHVHAEPTFVSVHCEIEWDELYDSEGLFVEPSFIQGDGADCTPANTDGFGKNFLTAIAFNRAFVRAVRTSLNIHVTGKDEISPAIKMDYADGDKSVNPTTPKSVLKSKLDKMGRSFEQFKDWWAKSYDHPAALEWNSINDIPDSYGWTIIGEFMKLEEKKGKKV